MLRTVGIRFVGDTLGLFRRTAPSFPHISGNLRFADSEMEEDDLLALTLPNAEPLETRVPIQQRILLLTEPSAFNPINAEYANQFGILIAPYQVRGFKGKWVPSHPGLPWFYGVNFKTKEQLSLQQLASMPIPDKLPEVSVVISSKVFHDGHRARLRFIEQLQKTLGSRLHVFGRGIREIEDKSDAIGPYAYHLALENTEAPSYWTEKLSDAFLGYSYPLYVGCPNAADWFPKESFEPLSLSDPNHAVATVKRVLDENKYADRFAAIKQAREIALHKETVFNVLQRAVGDSDISRGRLPEPEVIRPLKKSLMDRIVRESRRVFFNATFRKSIELK